MRTNTYNKCGMYKCDSSAQADYTRTHEIHAICTTNMYNKSGMYEYDSRSDACKPSIKFKPIVSLTHTHSVTPRQTDMERKDVIVQERQR